TIPCDMLVFAIGVTPNNDFLKDSGLDLDERGGIVVDRYLKTNLPDIWAAGDCASVKWFNDIIRPEQLWYTSRDQGKVVGENMVGSVVAYERGTFYNSAKFFDIEYTTAGLINMRVAGEQNWFHRVPGRYISQRITYLPDQTVIGVNTLGSRWDHNVFVRWIDERRSLEFVLEHFNEANFDEEFFEEISVPTSVG
ncbi:MAG: FAD-dependent oxidoreductase, partial [candidate division Zixibacteria bacterium]|nr:FAD-dependent oxidoreductase [candidate division Zixibacteria bacterium]